MYELNIFFNLVENLVLKRYFEENKINWVFNFFYVFYFGGVWERMIGVLRKILDSLFLSCKGFLIYEVLIIFLMEVSVIFNVRLFVVVLVDLDIL